MSENVSPELSATTKEAKGELGAKSGLEGSGGKEGPKFYRVGPQRRLSFYL